MRYAYENPDGSVFWHEQPLSAGPPPEHLAGARRSYRTEQVGGPHPKGWPMTCFASGVHAGDAQKLRDEFKRVGVPTEVTSDGDPVYTSPEHRRRALKARGMHDRAAYY